MKSRLLKIVSKVRRYLQRKYSKAELSLGPNAVTISFPKALSLNNLVISWGKSIITRKTTRFVYHLIFCFQKPIGKSTMGKDNFNLEHSISKFNIILKMRMNILSKSLKIGMPKKRKRKRNRFRLSTSHTASIHGCYRKWSAIGLTKSPSSSIWPILT